MFKRVFMIAALAALVGCPGGDDDDDNDTAQTCVPQATTGCKCPGGSAGVATCRDDGSGFGDCQGCPVETSSSQDASSGTATSSEVSSGIPSSGATSEASSTSGHGSSAAATSTVVTSGSPSSGISSALSQGSSTSSSGPSNKTCLDVGSAGGTIMGSGVVLTVPASALTRTTRLCITQTTNTAPPGYTAYSPLFTFEPNGTTFSKPVTVSIPFSGNQARADLFWSTATGVGFDRLGGAVQGSAVVGSITHFSTGFAGDGVEYTDPPDRSCARTAFVGGMTGPFSSLALFFTATDCQGRPLIGLTEADFILKEDAAPLSSEAERTIRPTHGLHIFASLVLDMSQSTRASLPQIIDSAKAFVNLLHVERSLPVQISIQLFAGESSLREWQAPTLDTPTLLSKLDALTTYQAQDPSSTNLYGTVINGLNRLDSARSNFEDRNHGGALTTGYLVLFTDGGDTAGLRTKTDAVNAVRASTNNVMGVGLSSPDYDASTLAALATAGVVSASSTTELVREFSALANRIAGQFLRTYQLAYCSPKRSGTHDVTVEVVGATHQAIASTEFNAWGFGPGCSVEGITTACDGRSCGGFVCGGCDDRTSECDDSGQCINFCDSKNQCSAAYVNPRGYTQSCPDVVTSTNCSGVCKDLTTDEQHCGTCNNVCPVGGSCTPDGCVCPANMDVCDGHCTDITTPEHCRDCTTVCAAGATCTLHGCACPAGWDLCAGICVDMATKHHCGNCDTYCLEDETCTPRGCIDTEWAQWPLPPIQPTQYSYNNATVTDNVTGLMWERTTTSKEYTWYQAVEYCSQMSRDGYSDWRLPTLIELYSIVDFGRKNPAINPVVFPNTPMSGYWTSTVFSGGFASLVTFESGVSLTLEQNILSHARCVR